MRIRLIEHDGEFWIQVRESPHAEPIIFPPEEIGIGQEDILYADFKPLAIEYYKNLKKEKENERTRNCRSSESTF